MKYYINDKEYDCLEEAILNISDIKETFDACIRWYMSRRLYSDWKIFELLGEYLYRKKDMFEFMVDTVYNIEQYIRDHDENEAGVEGLKVKR